MSQIPFAVWVQIGSVFASTVVTLCVFVWFLAKMKSEFDIRLVGLSGEIKLVQNTVHPYAKEIESGRARVLALTDRVTRIEASNETCTRDIKRLEDRIDSAAQRQR